uniref:HNH nuclease domain-containing protein n=1 Tax=Coccidioides posadasii RMSCC 3488 TaxID=454284 RepID=A0A0J6HZE0_COCPO|nr:hypothetical protein CPAG_00704 [Coccidioides posadasii RMSCC 3488]
MDNKVDDDKIGPGVELCDPVRLKLLKELQDIVGRVPQKAQASFLLCDLQYLQDLRKSSINPVVLEAVQRSLSDSKVDEIVAQWCQLSRPHSTASPARSLSLSHGHPKPSPLKHLAVANTKAQAPEEQEETEIPSQPSKRKRNGSRSRTSCSSGKSRSQYVSDECKNRDAHRCVVTKLAGPIDAAHIVPFSLNREDRRARFFSLLKTLWSQRIEKWKSLLENGTEFVENMISFTPTIHRYHSAGLFGLQPIEASLDGKSLKLKFYWLPQRETPSDTMTDITDIPTLPDDVELEDIKICNGKDEHLIKSGEVIELTTLDPEKRPLPNWDLLEMQWVLQRMTALRGAADLPDTVLDESDDLASFGYSEMEADKIFDEGLGGWCKQGVDEEAIEEDCWSGRVNNWIDTQQIQPQII